MRSRTDEGTPPSFESLNIRDRSTTPVVPINIGPPNPLNPKSRKRTFVEDDGNLDQPVMIVSPNSAQFNPDLNYKPYEHYSDSELCVMPKAKSRAPATEPPRPTPQVPSSNQASPVPRVETNARLGYSMRRQLETRPISEEQLINEVRGIYAGLVMVEKKCMEIDQQQASNKTKLSNEQWQALIALHRTLLHEHYDFFLASQHPSASPALRKLASKYAMPTRLWKHGIHTLLELLRQRLPETFEHMLAFLCTAYSMMTLLMESVPRFEETWIECLGHLARYRMAIEDTDRHDRDIWAGVAQHWYSKISGKCANSGRTQHHLADTSKS